MSLIKCRECGKEISDKAKKCNGCGAPIKIKIIKKKHRFILAFILVITLYIVFTVTAVIFSNFNYEKIPYCDDGYELENDRCIKVLETDVEKYTCPDDYELNNIKRCEIKSEFTLEPEITEYCSGTDKEVISKDAYGQDMLMCERTYGWVVPYKRYDCPDGYTEKSVTIGNTSGNHLCILDSYKDKDYQISATPVCPNGYQFEVKEEEYVARYEYDNLGISHPVYKKRQIDNCVKEETTEVKYRKE